MNRDEFTHRLRLATAKTLDFSRQFVWNNLPEHCRYIVVLGGAGPQNTLRKGEVIYPEDAGIVGPLDAKGVVELLWRESKVPEWINISAHSADEVATDIELLCCARFTDQERLLDFFGRVDTSPFQVRGPNLPPVWLSKDYSKFDLHWWRQRL